MSDQKNKNAGSSPAEKEPKNAGGVDDIEEGEERLDDEDRVEQSDARQAAGGGHSESEKPSSPDSRRSPQRNS